MVSTEKGLFYMLLSKIVFFISGYALFFFLGRFFLSPAEFGIFGKFGCEFYNCLFLLLSELAEIFGSFYQLGILFEEFIDVRLENTEGSF